MMNRVFLTIFAAAIFSFASSDAQASKKCQGMKCQWVKDICPKGEICYCTPAETKFKKSLLGRGQSYNYSYCKSTAKGSKLNQEFESRDPDTAVSMCQNECAEQVGEPAPPKPKLPDPEVAKVGACKGKSCYCTDGAKGKMAWESNCTVYNSSPLEVLKAFPGENQRDAVEECSRLCFGAQRSMIVQGPDGNWQAKIAK